MTGKELYTAMQNIDKDLVEESWDIKPTTKKHKFVWSERLKDNLATVAILCAVVLAVILIPKIANNAVYDDINPAGIEKTVAEETDKQAETFTAQETLATPEVNYDNVPEGAKVIDGILYEYDTWLNRYVVSQWSMVIGGGGVISETSGVGIAPKLSLAISGNALITESNADRMYYLVEVSESNKSGDYSQTGSVKELYSILTDLGNYGLSLGEAGNYKSNYGDFYICHDEFICGLMTYDDMKELYDKFAGKNPGKSLYYDLLSNFEVDKANIYTEEGVPKYSAEELAAEWKYVYSKRYGKYVVSKNYIPNGGSYSDSYSSPMATERITYSRKLKEAIASNMIINVDNAADMTYLVEINVTDISDNSKYNEVLSALGGGINDDKLKQEYERLRSACNYDIRLGEQFWQSDNSKVIIYGMLTYDQMKSIPVKDGYGYAFQIIDEITIGPTGIIEESLYGKDYTVIDAVSKIE